EVRGGQVYDGDEVVTVGTQELGTVFGEHALRLSPEAVENIGLRVDRVSRRPVAAVIETGGVVELPPDRRAVVGAQLSGTVQQIAAERDSVVRAGDVIGELYSLELHNLQLDLLQSHLQAELLDQTVRRLRSLAASGNPVLSSQELREKENAA